MLEKIKLGLTLFLLVFVLRKGRKSGLDLLTLFLLVFVLGLRLFLLVFVLRTGESRDLIYLHVIVMSDQIQEEKNNLT